MRKLLLPLGLAAIWLSPFHVQARPATPLTLDHAQEIAAAHSPALSAARHEVDAAHGAWRQAGALRNPTLNVLVEDTRSSTRTTTTTVDIPIELGGKREARRRVADRARDIAQAELGNARARLRADVTQAFFAVLVAQQRLELTRNSSELALRAAQAVGKRVTAGKTSPVDETRAKVDQANAELQTAEASSVLESSRRALATLLGDAEVADSQVLGDLEPMGEARATSELLNAMEGAPALVSSRLEVERRRSMAELERRQRTPDLTLSLGARRDNELARTQAVIGISIPLPLFDRNEGATYEATQRAEKAEDALQEERIRLRTQLQDAAGQLSLARASAMTLRSTVLPAAQQAYEAASIGFEAGKFSFLDVLDAQRSLLQARSTYLAALASSNQAATAIDRLLGR